MAGTVMVSVVAGMFVEFADTLVDDFDVVDFLHRLSERTAELLDPGVVGIYLSDSVGDLQFIAASQESSALIQLFEIGAREGPSWEVFLTGSPLSFLDLQATDPGWPVFGARAAALGFTCGQAFPMRLRGQVIGVLSVLSREALVVGPHDQVIVQALVDVATIGLLQERAIRHGDVLAGQLQTALASRVVIEQAKGALAQFHQISVDEAFVLLRRYARNRGRRLSEVAALVTSTGPAVITEPG